jgi:hypothetical protein
MFEEVLDQSEYDLNTVRLHRKYELLYRDNKK